MDTQASLLLDSLKTLMKKRRIKYRDIAQKLNVSEITVKRLFSSKSCTLERLEEVCDVIGLELLDLWEFSRNRQERTYSFTIEEERIFASKIELFFFYDCLKLRPHGLESTIKTLNITKAQGYKYLKLLEKAELLSLEVNDRIRYKYLGTLNFIVGGPLQSILLKGNSRAFIKHVLSKKEGVLKKAPLFTYSTRRVSPQNYSLIESEIQRVFQEFRNLAHYDEKLMPLEELIEVQWMGILGEMPEAITMVERKARIFGNS